MIVSTKSCPKCGGAMERKDDYDQGVRRGEQWSCINCGYSAPVLKMCTASPQSGEENIPPWKTRPDTTGLHSRTASKILRPWFESHKDEIIADLENFGFKSKVCKKWGISPGTFESLLLSWKYHFSFSRRPEPVEIERETEPVADQSPEVITGGIWHGFPEFNEGWSDKVKVQWLICFTDIYIYI